MSRFFILFILLSSNIHAQYNTVFDVEAIKAFAKKDSLRKDSIKTLILSTKWDTGIFNPFKGEKIQFPFQLKFDDVFFAPPVSKENVITSRYGWRWGKAHKGIDIDLISGDNVIAILDGKVRYLGYHSGHGRTIIIRHYNGLETVYAHLSKYNVKINETVSKGQLIGKGGRTGNARGSHVHLETVYKGYHINPEYLFSFDNEHKINRNNFWITKDWVTPFLHNSKISSDFVYFDTYEEAKKSKGIKQKIHIVKRGDTLFDISRKYNISISRICKVNSILRNSTLRIGQELVLGY